LGALLRPGNAGANTACDHKTVLDLALAQIPAEYIEAIEILVRADRAGATHALAEYCREGRMRFSFGYDLTDTVRHAILETPEDDWVPALDQDGSERENGEVCEITDRADLSSWPEGTRLIVRRERPHPGAQLSFTDHDGYRFRAILTDQPDPDIAVLERQHRQRARVEDRIRDDKDTGLAKLPFKEFALNEVWLEIVLLAHDLIVWTPSAAVLRRASKGRAQATAIPAAARRRPTRFLRTTRQASPPTNMALGRRARRRVRAPEGAPSHRCRTAANRPPQQQDHGGRPQSPLRGHHPGHPTTLPRKRCIPRSPPTPRPERQLSPRRHRRLSPSRGYCTIRASGRLVAGRYGEAAVRGPSTVVMSPATDGGNNGLEQ
jgi:DDE family transposase